MATNTPKLNLVKPALNDNVDVTQLNGNMDILDDAITSLPDATTSSPGVVLGTTSDGNNTALGSLAFVSNTTGTNHTAVGRRALNSNTEGQRNTAVGEGSLADTTTGSFNTAVGEQSSLSNTTGANNSAFGRRTIRNATTGNNNTAVGFQALVQNTVGNDNTVIGSGAAEGWKGDTATVIGRNALRSAVNDGVNSDVVAIGRAALAGAVNPFRDIGIGRNALNSANGSEYNVAIGWTAADSLTTARDCVAIGRGASNSLTTGGENTAVGYLAGNITTTGVINTSIGSGANPSSATASNEVTLGGSTVTALRCNVTTITSLSDVRDKTDIEETSLGLEVVNKLRPVEFTWDRRDGTMGDTPDIGFIAQDLAALEDELGETDRLRLTLRENPDKLEAAPGRLLPILVKAVQELSAQNDELRARIETLEAK